MYYALEDIQVSLDYAGSTIGLRFDTAVPKRVGRVELEPTLAIHRVNRDGLKIYAKGSNAGDFTEVAGDNWDFKKDAATGKVVLSFKTPVAAVEIKVHAIYDDRDLATGIVKDISTFKNNLKSMVTVYERHDRTKIAYEYDLTGNRTSETYTDVATGYNVTYTYGYYPASDRLMTRESRSISNERPLVGTQPGGYVDGIVAYGTADKTA